MLIIKFTTVKSKRQMSLIIDLMLKVYHAELVANAVTNKVNPNQSNQKNNKFKQNRRPKRSVASPGHPTRVRTGQKVGRVKDAPPDVLYRPANGRSLLYHQT